MCLAVINPIPEKYRDKTKIHRGWKIFTNSFGRLQLPYRTFNGRAIVPGEKWLHSTEYRIRLEHNDGFYDSGFHLFSDKREAQGYSVGRSRPTVVQIKFRNVVAFGEQNGYSGVVVAREIYIPKKLKRA